MKPLFYLLTIGTLLLNACTQHTAPALKVISYNIRLSAADDGTESWQYRKQATLEMIRREHPDLLGVQEGLIDQVQYLETNCPQYARLGVGRDDGSEAGEIMALFYLRDRFDLLQSGTFWLSETPDTVSRGWDAAYNRTATWGCFRDKISGREVCYFNTHLDNMGVEAREQSVKLLVEKIREIAPAGAAVILGGDLNSSAEDPIFRPFDALLTSARDTSPITDHKATFSGYGHAGTPAIIDHLFFAHLTPLSFRTLDGDYGVPYISDHYPIEAVLEL